MMLPKRWGFRLWLDCVLETTQRKSGFFLRLLHNRKQRALFAFLTIVPIKSQVYLQQQTKQSSSRNIQDLKVLGNFVSGCAFLLFFCVFSNSRNYGCEYMKVPYLNCGWRREYDSDLHSEEHYLTSIERKAWKKFRPVRDLNPWPLRYRCSALPTELTSQLGAGHCVDSK